MWIIVVNCLRWVRSHIGFDSELKRFSRFFILEFLRAKTKIFKNNMIRKNVKNNKKWNQHVRTYVRTYIHTYIIGKLAIVAGMQIVICGRPSLGPIWGPMSPIQTFNHGGPLSVTCMEWFNTNPNGAYHWVDCTTTKNDKNLKNTFKMVNFGPTVDGVRMIRWA